MEIMKILKKVQVIFLSLLILFSSKPVLCEVEGYGAALLYAYHNGQAYLLVAFDSDNNCWDSFNCELEEKDNLYEKISLYAHLGTRGVFAGLNDLILRSESSEDDLMGLDSGMTFFRDRLKKTETINYAKKEQADFTCIIKPDYDVFLFFISVPFVSAQIFVDSFYPFKKIYKNCQSSNAFEYLKKTGFAWIKIQDLVNIIENRKASGMNTSRPIYLRILQGKTFLAKTSQLKRRFPDNKIVLNSYFTEELSSDSVMDILKKIINSSPNQYKWVTKSSRKSKK